MRRAFQESNLPRFSRRTVVGGFAAALTAAGLQSSVRAWPTAPPARVSLDVTPVPAPFDAPFSVRVGGFIPNMPIMIRAQTVDDAQVTWTAWGEFTADATGRLDLSTQAPLHGSYATADPMGLIWSMTPSGQARNNTSLLAAVQTPPVTIDAMAAGRVVARIDVVLRVISPAITNIPMGPSDPKGVFFRPAGRDPVGAILLLGGSEGGISPLVEREAALLAQHGFAALALAYFGYPGLPFLLERIPLDYFGPAIDWLRKQLGTSPGRVGVIGHSRGGELALLLGATFPQIAAVVSYSGSGLVFPSPTDMTIPAWTSRGEALPDIHNAPHWHDAVIAVESIDGPVLLISGQDDRVWDAPLYSQIALDRLVANHHPHDDEHHAYRDAGHFILAPYSPTSWRVDGGGTPAGLAAADADAWPRVVKLFGDRLTPS